MKTRWMAIMMAMYEPKNSSIDASTNLRLARTSTAKPPLYDSLQPLRQACVVVWEPTEAIPG